MFSPFSFSFLLSYSGSRDSNCWLPQGSHSTQIGHSQFIITRCSERPVLAWWLEWRRYIRLILSSCTSALILFFLALFSPRTLLPLPFFIFWKILCNFLCPDIASYLDDATLLPVTSTGDLSVVVFPVTTPVCVTVIPSMHISLTLSSALVPSSLTCPQTQAQQVYFDMLRTFLMQHLSDADATRMHASMREVSVYAYILCHTKALRCQ